MPKPLSTADFGTVVPGAAIPAPAVSPNGSAYHARFVDVKTYAAGSMPHVKVGQVYEDLDPRCKGRHVQVLKVGGDGKVMVRTIKPRTCPPRTQSKEQKDTTGAISFIALRRFRENSRGFRLLRGSTIRSIHAYFIASRLCAACNLPVTEAETRLADALIGLLGNRLAHEYLDALILDDGQAARDLYLNGSMSTLLDDALCFATEADETDGWYGTEVASAATARTVASHS